MLFQSQKRSKIFQHRQILGLAFATSPQNSHEGRSPVVMYCGAKRTLCFSNFRIWQIYNRSLNKTEFTVRKRNGTKLLNRFVKELDKLLRRKQDAIIVSVFKRFGQFHRDYPMLGLSVEELTILMSVWAFTGSACMWVRTQTLASGLTKTAPDFLILFLAFVHCGFRKSRSLTINTVSYTRYLREASSPRKGSSR